mgnify:FL=1
MDERSADEPAANTSTIEAVADKEIGDEKWIRTEEHGPGPDEEN